MEEATQSHGNGIISQNRRDLTPFSNNQAKK